MNQAEAEAIAESMVEKPQSRHGRTELLVNATKIINSDRLLSPQQIQSLMGIDISHHRDRIKEQMERDKALDTSETSSFTETFFIVLIAIGLSVGIGLVSLDIL